MAEENVLAKLKKCKTVEELKTVGKEIGYELTDEEAKSYFDRLTKSGELSDNELSNVSGGGCTKWRNGKAYSGNPPHYLIVTMMNACSLYDYYKERQGPFGVCLTCGHCEKPFGLTFYCTKRTWDNDPLNPKK